MSTTSTSLQQGGVEGAVPRAFAVLEWLALAPEPVRLSAVALQLGLQKSTVHRILATLIERGYVEQIPESGCYRATLRLWEMGSGLISQHPIKRTATPYLQQLHGVTGETVSLMILTGDDVLYLDKIVSPRPMPFTSRPGSRLPAPLTAGGKALLSLNPNADAVVRRVRASLHNKGLLNLTHVRRDLDEARQRGYATSQFRTGVRSVGAAVVDQSGAPVAALSVSAPLTRIDDQKQADMVEQLLGTCAAISENLGYR